MKKFSIPLYKEKNSGIIFKNNEHLKIKNNDYKNGNGPDNVKPVREQ